MLLRYYVYFGSPSDGSEEIEYDYDAGERLEKIYINALKRGIDLESIPELENVVDDAVSDVESDAECLYYYDDDPHVARCRGYERVEAYEINNLVKDRDEYTLDYFDLNDLSEEELDKWDANDIDLPQRCDFEEDFEEEGLFEDGSWEVVISLGYFSSCLEHEHLKIEESEVKKYLRELFNSSNGNYYDVYDYIDNFMSDETDIDISAIAEQTAKEMGFDDFRLD